MPVESAADRATLLADFGEAAIFSPGAVWPNRSSASCTITGIFDFEYLPIDGGDTRLSSSNPVFFARTADLADVVRDSVIERVSDGGVYKVAAIEPDGTGMTLLQLEGPR